MWLLSGTRELCGIEYFKLVFLKYINVPTWSIFTDLVTFRELNDEQKPINPLLKINSYYVNKKLALKLQDYNNIIITLAYCLIWARMLFTVISMIWQWHRKLFRTRDACYINYWDTFVWRKLHSYGITDGKSWTPFFLCLYAWYIYFTM